MTTLAWVVGSGGLLGQALVRHLSRDAGTRRFVPAARFAWDAPDALLGQIESAVRAFAAAAQSADHWHLYWAAGVGTMNSLDDDLAAEAQALGCLLRALEGDIRLMQRPGAFALASSAGAIHAGSRDDVITEATPVAPTTPYARAKLEQESLIRAFVARNPGQSALIARFSTLYGPGQSAGKKQGLLTHIARCIVQNRPVQIYVPFDTIRDYLAADDAARDWEAALSHAGQRQGVLLKIIASEQPTTIAEIVSVFGRVSPRPPRVITSASKLSALYARRIQFRSIERGFGGDRRRTPLAVGIAQLLQAERMAHAGRTRS